MHKHPVRFGFILARNFTLSSFSLFVDALRLASDDLDNSGRKGCDWDIERLLRNDPVELRRADIADRQTAGALRARLSRFQKFRFRRNCLSKTGA